MTLVELLHSLERGRVHDELWPVRRKKKRLRKTKRLPLIDDILAEIELQLRSIDFQVPTEPLDPKQYQQALQDSPYKPLLEAVQTAHNVVSAYRRGRINGRRAWPKGRRNIPHMDKIISLKKDIHNNMTAIHFQHKCWQMEYQKK